MRRSNVYYISEARFVANIFALFFYQAMSAIFQYLPPLIGLFFCYMMIEMLKLGKNFEKFNKYHYAILAYMFFAEQICGFYLFSVVIAFMIYYFLIKDALFATIKSRQLIILISVASGYILLVIVNFFISYLSDAPFLIVGKEYLFFIIVESILAILFYKDKLI